MAVPRANASTATDPADEAPRRWVSHDAMTAPAAAAPAVASERRTSPIELLWDLVFVFAITQVTTLLSRDLAWRGLGRSMLVLALVWWAWSAFVWAANAEEEEAPALRLILLVAMVLIFISGLAIPRAFGGEATLFATTYVGVRLLHLGLYADASRRGNASWRAIAGFALTVAIGMALLVVGSLLHGWHRDALWGAAVAIDYAGPGLLTRARLRGLQEVAVAHFAERYGLFVIICLGESVVAIGLGASGDELSAEVVAAVALGLLVTVGLWWTYFERFASTAQERLRNHADPVLAAADAYSYLHLLLVAGIIVFAVGVKVSLRHVGQPLADAPRLALCGGIALYLLGHAAFRLRLSGEVNAEKIGFAAALIVLFAVGSELPAWSVLALAAATLTALCALEAALARRRAPALR
jgi:low temperature requirement protein LtrA